MLNKKAKVLLFMFLILFCIAAVNAEPIDNNTDTQSIEIMNVESEANLIATVADTPETVGNFSDLNRTINNNTNNEIQLDKNYTYDNTKDTNFKNGIVINRTLTIDGQGHTIDGKNAARIFNVTAGSLTIKNIILVNGALVNGSAIYNNGDGILTIINSTFKDNAMITTTTSNNNNIYGGAIYSSNNVTVINSTFSNNSINKQNSNTIYVYGGAIYCTGNVNVSNSIFRDNGANMVKTSTYRTSMYVYGGAIYCTNNITAVNSNFNNNSFNLAYSSISGSGGAIYSNSVNIISSNFTNNNNNYETQNYYAGNSINGGAIYCTKYANIVNSNFVNNSICKRGSSTGGAIYSGDNVTVSNSTFNHQNGWMGGAIYSSKSVIVENSIFNNNSATGYSAINGGAIYANDNVDIRNSSFENNSAAYGGAIYSQNGSVNIVDSNFTKNSGEQGGAILANQKITVVGSNFIQNSVGNQGGAIYGTDNLTISNSNFINNSARVNGGAIFSEERLLKVTDSNFENNTAPTGGAIFGYNMSIINSNFTRNNGDLGGAIANSYYLNITNSNFIENTAEYGGAIYMDAVLLAISKADIVGSNFIDNEAINGGAIYVAIGNVAVDESKFTGNKAVKGGAIEYTNFYYENMDILNKDYPYDNFDNVLNVSLTVKNSEFDENQADYGDDIYTGFNTTVVNNSYTKDSYANIYANNTIVNCTVVTVLGNGTYYVDPEGKFKVNATVFADGASVDGYNLVITDGKNKYNATYLGYGVYGITEEITADFIVKHYSAIINNKTDDSNYVVKNGTVIVYNFNLKVENLTKYYGNDGKFVIVLTDAIGNPLSNRTVNITINGVTYTRTTDENGTIFMGINLDMGVYEAEVSFDNVTKTATITILSTIEAEDLVKYYLNGTQYYATFYDVNGKPLTNTNVTFNINGVFYTRTTDENGTAKLNINLNPGEYILTAINPINNQTYSNNVTVLSTIVGEDIVKYFKNGTQYYAVFKDLDGSPLANKEVTFNIHGVFYTRTTDENGIAKLTINLNPGEYIITAINPVNNETYSNRITVLTVVETENVEMSVNARKPFKATILGDHGEPLANAEVTFNIHGVFYHKITDANGEVNLDINLISGRYIITTYYNSYSVSNIITIV